jgi:hypothetical protein
MAKIRSLLAIAAGAALVGGCAVAPYDNGYGYGYGYGNGYDYPGYPGYAPVSPYDDDPFYEPGYYGYGPSVGLGFSFGGVYGGGHHHDHDGHDWHGHREGRDWHGDGGHQWHGDGGGSRGGGTPDNGHGG